MDVLARNNVAVSGRADGRAMIFAHGFACDQHMWRLATGHCPNLNAPAETIDAIRAFA